MTHGGLLMLKKNLPDASAQWSSFKTAHFPCPLTYYDSHQHQFEAKRQIAIAKDLVAGTSCLTTHLIDFHIHQMR